MNDTHSLRPIPFPETLHSHINGVILKMCSSADSESIECQCILDELVFYLIRLSFPQTLINFLLGLLPNVRYKVLFYKK